MEKFKKIFNNKRNIFIGLIVILALLVFWSFKFNSNRDMMLVPRIGFTATLLKDGNVLITGGEYGWDVFKSAEIYNPKTHKSHYTGSMNKYRSGHKAILLDDGRVLIVGGGLINTIKPAEIYNPKTGKFTFTDSLSTKMKHNIMKIMKLHNGKILVFGDDLTEIYDPQTNKFKVLGIPKYNSFGDIDAVELYNNKVLIVGRATQEIKEEIFTSRKGLFSKPNYPYNYEHQTLANGTNVNIEKFGSKFKKTTYKRMSSIIFDLKTNKFYSGPNMLKPRRDPKAVELKDGRVLVFGGDDLNAKPFQEVEIYNPKTNKFSLAGKMKKQRFTSFQPVLLKNNKVYIVGNDYFYGKDINHPAIHPLKSTCEVYNLNNYTSKFTNKCIWKFKGNIIPILLPNEKMLLVGGITPNLFGENGNELRKIKIINTKGIR